MNPRGQKKSDLCHASPGSEVSPPEVRQHLHDRDQAKSKWLDKHGKEPLRLDFTFLDAKSDDRFFRYGPPLSVTISDLIRKAVLAYVESNVEFPELDKTILDYAPAVLAETSQHHLSLLRAIAEAGNSQALEEMAKIANLLTIQLNLIANREKSIEFAKGFASWPVLASPFPHFRHNAVALLKEFQVGTSPLKHAEPVVSRLNIGHGAPELALYLKARLDHWRERDRDSIYWNEPYPWFPPTKAEDDASRLPIFDARNWDKWLEMAWKILLEENDGEPERNKSLRALGKFKEDKSKPKKLSEQKEHEYGADSNIRDGIKQKLKGAFKTLALGKRSPKFGSVIAGA